MASIAQLWLPILLSAVFVFIASSIVHMMLKFWHTPDYRGFSNEDAVAAAIRNSGSGAGMYMIPYCKPEAMKDPATVAKFAQGPVGLVTLRKPGAINMGAFMGQWFVFCLVVSLFAAVVGMHVLAAGTPHGRVLCITGMTAFMAYGLGSAPNAIWWGTPWTAQLKYVVDGVIYALVTGATFTWLWPTA